MAASLAAVKKELRRKIRNMLKDLPDAAAASQSMQRLL
jgi:5-formyltetrahydrofolate cyclo-ligase